MGLTKQYLRYAPSGIFNIIASADCNNTHVSLNGVSGRYVAVGACEHVIIWDLRLGEKAQVLSGENVVVSQIAASPSGNHMAVGYVDGNINVFDLTNNEIVCVFAGHKSAITSLQYDQQGHRLVSGSKDTDVILWDVVSETGIARFSGHKGAITSVAFINSRNCLLSSSKDTFVKFWDIETRHCFKTLGGHQTEVWSAVLMKEEEFLVTGGAEPELRVFRLRWTSDTEEHKLARHLEIVKLEDAESTEESSLLQCNQVGTLMRSGRGRVVSLTADLGQQVLACFGTDSLLELFAFCSDRDAKQRMEKRVKKQRKKLQKQKETKEADVEATEIPSLLTLRDEVRRVTSVKMAAKIKSASLLLGTSGELRAALTLANNTVELHSLRLDDPTEVSCLKQISLPGHQKEPRCVTISSDNLAVLSASADSIKMWSRASQSCLRTVPVPGARPTCVCLCPGERHALAGTADGHLLLLDVAAGALLEQRGCFSGGADRTVKLWNFELVPDPSGDTKAKVLSLLHTRTLELEESVLAVQMSPNSKFIAVALLDATVKIFFYDTFKFFLSLYGHQLPALCLDVSWDGALLASGSADRSVRVWGLDFGDCRRALPAHALAVAAVRFLPDTHLLLSAGRDGKVKQWDADSFQLILTLDGHAGECWGLAVGSGGLHVVSCGGDGALRLYSRTEEPLVLGDTDEGEEGLATGDKAPIPSLPNLNLPTKKTIGAEKAADSILECLEIGSQYRQELHEARGQNVQVPLLMAAYNCSTPEDFLLETLKKIRSSELEEALLLLPFASACSVLRAMPALLGGGSPELVCRAAGSLLRAHRGPLGGSRAMLKGVTLLQAGAAMALARERDMVGYNVHALQWLQRDTERAAGEQLFRGEEQGTKEKGRRKRTAKRPIVTVT